MGAAVTRRDTPSVADPDTAPRRPLHAVSNGHALYLDIDGTLVDLAPDPDAVEVPDGLPALLQRLSVKLGGALAFVSGRPIAAIDELFRPLKLAAIGVHGGEIRTPGGPVDADRSLADESRAALAPLRAAISHLPGVMLEDKGCAFALHYRAAPECAAEVLRLAEREAGSLGSRFGVLPGKCVVEIRPRHWTKGAAIQRLMQCAPFQRRTPVFAGDDRTDEDAFELVNRLGGISLRVGDTAPSAARYRLSSPQQLRAWLLDIARGQERL